MRQRGVEPAIGVEVSDGEVATPATGDPAGGGELSGSGPEQNREVGGHRAGHHDVDDSVPVDITCRDQIWRRRLPRRRTRGRGGSGPLRR
jgi:hypothetical protein